MYSNMLGNKQFFVLYSMLRIALLKGQSHEKLPGV
jgi:hypothetical protein